ncbi:MAG: hypothetical protein ACLR4A_10645 [Christensenellales bacterium]
MLLAPMLRLFLLFLAAVTGLEFLAVLALLEPYALLHPRLLPAALVRAAFLPMTAVCAFNSFLRTNWLVRRFCVFVSRAARKRRLPAPSAARR